MVGREDYALFYKTACNIFEETFEFINQTDDDYYFMNIASIKLLKHLNTTEMLMTTELDLNYVEKGHTYYDTSSVIVFLRVIYENLVTISYHYFDGELDKDRLDFYQLLGYKNRAKYEIKHETPELNAKIQQEKKIIDEITDRLRLNNFTPPQKNKKYEWKPCGWSDLGKQLGIPKNMCKQYSYWSSHTHSGFDSLLQVNTAHNTHPTEEIKRNNIHYVFMCGALAYFTEGYVRVLDKLGYPHISDLDIDAIKDFLNFMNLIDNHV
jgi:hypothetical protein